MAMTAREVEREPENDPELCSVRYYLQSGDWSQSKMPHYLSVKNELCAIGKLVMKYCTFSTRGASRYYEDENPVENESLVAQNRL